MKIKKTLEKILLYGVLSIPLIFAGCDKNINKSGPQRYGSIQGQITKPVILGDNKIHYFPYEEGLNVALQETEFTTITDSLGKYNMEDIPEGEYKIEGNSHIGLAKTLGVISQNPNYDVVTSPVKIQGDTTIKDMQLTPSIGYPRQILHGKVHSKDKVTPVIGKDIDIGMAWGPLHPVTGLPVHSALIMTSTTSDSGRYASYIGEEEYVFLMDRDKSNDSTGDVFLNFVNSEGEEQKYLNVYKDSLGILYMDACLTENEQGEDEQ